LYLTKEEMKTLEIYKTRKDELVEKWNTLTIIQKVYKLSKIKDNNMLDNIKERSGYKVCFDCGKGY